MIVPPDDRQNRSSSIDRSPGGKKIFEEAENFMIKKWQEAL
jgi:hypothetical protein